MAFLPVEVTYSAHVTLEAEEAADFPYTRGNFFPLRSKTFTDLPYYDNIKRRDIGNLTDKKILNVLLDTYDKCFAITKNHFGDKHTVRCAGCNG